MPNKVYVVLHGLISLAEEVTNNQFRAFLIDMPDHRVAAGHWLTEMTIPKGALLQLTGVVTGSPATAPLDRSKNIVFPRSTTPINQARRNQYRYAEIILPWPSTITSLNSTDIGPDLSGGVTQTGATLISDTQVFEYDVVAGKRPSLVGDSSTPWKGLVLFEALNVASSTIHILNEPDATADTGHVVEEFRRSAEIFNSTLHRSTGLPPGLLSGVPAALVPDVLHEESLPLALRQGRVFDMVGEARKAPPGAYKTQPPGGAVGGGLVCSGGHGG